jgi:hypothetical protein
VPRVTVVMKSPSAEKFAKALGALACEVWHIWQ